MRTLLALLLSFSLIATMTACNNAAFPDNNGNSSSENDVPSKSESLYESSSDDAEQVSAVNEDISAYIYVERDDFVIDEELKVNTSEKPKIATKEYLSDFSSFISNLKISDIKKLYISIAPSFKQGKTELSEQEAEHFITKLKELKIELLPESELENPLTGGAWRYYIETQKAAYKVAYNGLWFSVAHENETSSNILMCANDDGIGADIHALVERHLEDAPD